MSMIGGSAVDAVTDLLQRLPHERDEARSDAWLEEVARVLDRELRDVDRARLLEARSLVRANAVPLSHPTDAAQLFLDAARAAELFESAGMTLEAAAAYATAACGAAHTGQLEVALDIAVRALAAYSSASEQRQDPAASSRLANRLGILCYQFSDYAAAREFFLMSAAQANEIGDVLQWSTARYNVGDVLELRLLDDPVGIDLAEREVLLAELEEVGRSLIERSEPDAVQTVDGPRLLAAARCQQGRHAEAMELLDAAQAASGEPPVRGGVLSLLRTRAGCLVGLGRPDEALPLLDTVLERVDAEWDAVEHALALQLRSAARRAVGDLRGALADARMLSHATWERHQRQLGGFLGQVLARAGIEGERRVLIARAEQLSRTLERDPLTGVGNRRFVEHLLMQLVPDEPLALAMVDLDAFKAVNDTFGHDVGDCLLVELAEVLTRACREGDQVARWGGEEFVVVMPRTLPQDGLRVAEALKTAVEGHHWSAARQPLRLTVSIGVVHGTPADGPRLVERADEAMYAAKAGGRNMVVAWGSAPRRAG